MAQRTLSAPPADLSSGAGMDVLSDANALTYASVGLGAFTLGGAAFVAAAVAPAHVIGGTLATATCLAGSEVKRRTGSYLPFLDSKEDKAPVASVTAPSPESAPAAA